MAKALSNDDLRRFARLGAMRRLEDMRHEEAAIRATFPELFRGAAKATKATKVTKATKAAKNPAAPKATRKRSKMSPAMRKAVSERMKKYWAGRRKAKNG